MTKLVVHGWKDTEFGRRIDVKLYDMVSVVGKVYWSPRWGDPNSGRGCGGCNSYVLAEAARPPMEHEIDVSCWMIDGKWAKLYSVNGAGEVRWDVSTHQIEEAEKWEEEHPGEEMSRGWNMTEQIEAARFFRLVPPRGK
jgi:hypothetical protein